MPFPVLETPFWTSFWVHAGWWVFGLVISLILWLVRKVVSALKRTTTSNPTA